MSVWTAVWRYGVLWGYVIGVPALIVFHGFSIFYGDAAPWWAPLRDGVVLLPIMVLTAVTVRGALRDRASSPTFRRPPMKSGLLGFLLGGLAGGAYLFCVALFVMILNAPEDGQAALGAISIAFSGGVAGALLGAIIGMAPAAHSEEER